MKIVVNTDGCCIGNPGPGGYGIVFDIEGTDSYLLEGVYAGERTTNNIMELRASLEALKHLDELNLRTEMITIESDSRYVINGITEWIVGWRLKSFGGVKNKELWMELDSMVEKFDYLKWKWVKGHSGLYLNELADNIANEAVEKKERVSKLIPR